MNLGKLLFLISFFMIFTSQLLANDLEHSVSGDDIEDVLAKNKVTGPSPFVVEDANLEVDKQKINKNADPDFVFTENKNEPFVKDEIKSQLKDVGYTPPGTFENKENYLEIDKKSIARDFRNHSSGNINLVFTKNNFNYESTNDVINKTIGEGYRHVKGGSLNFSGDQFFFQSSFLNSFWSLGAGIGYNSGHGVYITNERSEATFKLWEIPLDLGIGLELPIYHWFKISGTAGPSLYGLYQNRDDIQSGEKGKNKVQVSYGQFLKTQFKINLSGFSPDMAYTLFTESKITNLYLNLEARYQNYQNFQDQIKISGTSFGIGFTFEYL